MRKIDPELGDGINPSPNPAPGPAKPPKAKDPSVRVLAYVVIFTVAVLIVGRFM